MNADVDQNANTASFEKHKVLLMNETFYFTRYESWEQAWRWCVLEKTLNFTFSLDFQNVIYCPHVVCTSTRKADIFT